MAVTATAAALVASALLGGTAHAAATAGDRGRASATSGCGTVHAAGVSFLGGQPRAVRMVTPRGYTGRSPVPLVVLLHPSDSNGYRILQESRLQATADAHGFVIAVPDGGIKRGGTLYSWNVPGVPLAGGGDPPAGSPDDDAYLSGLVDTVPNTYCIDRSRVYVTGFSGGARMASQFGCDHSGKLAAIAPVAGLRAGIPDRRTLQPIPATCNEAIHLAVVAFHGDADTENPYGGNRDPRWGYSVDQAGDRWATVDACRERRAVNVPITQNATGVHLLAHRGCESGTAVYVYKIAGGTHRWPDPAKIDANETMWAQFTHFRRT